jgi:uncharacterized protein YqgC (DUF456 family)
LGHTIAVLILALCLLAGLVLIPLGLPGLWVMVAGVVGYGALTNFHAVGVTTIASVLGLALLGEVLEWRVGFGLARRYGGSPRAGWGALAGGIAGAIVGAPVPVLWSVIGALLGSFLGAAIFEYSWSATTAIAVRAGWGAVLGRAAAVAVKTSLGIVIAVVGVVAALRG